MPVENEPTEPEVNRDPDPIPTDERPPSLAEALASEDDAAEAAEPTASPEPTPESGTPTEPVETPEPTEGEPAADPIEPVEGEPAPEGEEPAAAAPASALHGYFEKEYGKDKADALLAKYGNDKAVLDGLYSASQLVGRRDEMAEYGKRMLIEQQTRTQQAAQQQPQPQQHPQQQAPVAPPTSDQIRNWEMQVQAAEAAQQQPPAEAVQGLTAYRRDAQQALYDMTYNRQAALQPVLQEHAQQVQQGVQQQVVQQTALQQETQQITAWRDEHRDWLFNGGNAQNGFTPQGEQLANLYNEAQTTLRNPTPGECIQYGLDKIEAMQSRQRQVAPAQPAQPAIQPTAAPKAAAQHKANVAMSTPTSETNEHPNDTLSQALQRKANLLPA